MSNKISLDIEVYITSNAEKAIVDLTRDVDKLQRKAAQTNFGGGWLWHAQPLSNRLSTVKTAKNRYVDLK